MRAITFIEAEPPRRNRTRRGDPDDFRRFLTEGKAGPFQVHGVLGSGGMGIVLDATSPSGHRVALKLLRLPPDAERERMLRARFSREAELVGRVNHPGVAGRVDAGELAGIPYLALELVEGVSLSTLRAQGPLELPTVLSLGAQLADALTHLHGRGIVHRDIKPTNVLVTRGGRAVLTDFGVAWSSSCEPITHVGEIVGTPGYLAPELLEDGGAPSPLSDIYALGFLLFEIAAARPRPPLRGSLYEQFLLAQMIDLSRFSASTEWAPLRALLERMLASEPSARSATAASVRTELVLMRRALLPTSSPARPEQDEPWDELSPYIDDTMLADNVTEPSLRGDPGLARLGASLAPETTWAGGGFDTPSRMSVRQTDMTLSERDPARTPVPVVEAPSSSPVVAIHGVAVLDPALAVQALPAAKPPIRLLPTLAVFGLALIVIAAALVEKPEPEKLSRALGQPLYRSTLTVTPGEEARREARAAFLQGHELAETGHLPEAVAALGKCIEVGDLQECHGLLGRILSEAAAEHLTRAAGK